MTGIETALIIAAVAGTATSVLGAQAQSKSQGKIAEFNAQVAKNSAIAANQAADADVSRIRADTRRRLATIRAKQAVSGIVLGEGSALLAEADQIAEGEFSVKQRLFKGELQSRGFDIQSSLDLAQASAFKTRAKNQLVAGGIQIAGQVAGGFSSGSGLLTK